MRRLDFLLLRKVFLHARVGIDGGVVPANVVAQDVGPEDQPIGAPTPLVIDLALGVDAERLGLGVVQEGHGVLRRRPSDHRSDLAIVVALLVVGPQREEHVLPRGPLDATIDVVSIALQPRRPRCPDWPRAARTC